jgi:hypothetical protein
MACASTITTFISFVPSSPDRFQVRLRDVVYAIVKDIRHSTPVVARADSCAERRRVHRQLVRQLAAENDEGEERIAGGRRTVSGPGDLLRPPLRRCGSFQTCARLTRFR